MLAFLVAHQFSTGPSFCTNGTQTKLGMLWVESPSLLLFKRSKVPNWSLTEANYFLSNFQFAVIFHEMSK